MENPEKQLVVFSERTRPVIYEDDLESNFSIIKEALLSCFEHILKDPAEQAKEIPNLSEFEAGWL